LRDCDASPAGTADSLAKTGLGRFWYDKIFLLLLAFEWHERKWINGHTLPFETQGRRSSGLVSTRVLSFEESAPRETFDSAQSGEIATLRPSEGGLARNDIMKARLVWQDYIPVTSRISHGGAQMNIAFDSHKRYTFCSVSDESGGLLHEARIEHKRGAIATFLSGFPPGQPVAVETIGNWYWIVDEIEAAGMIPQLVHARKAKLMIGNVNKTDRLDVRGLNRLQQTGTLPTVWIPGGELRDQRDLPRTRMYLVAQRTRLKNRIHAALAKYALRLDEVSDIFGQKGRRLLEARLEQMPPHTRYAVEWQLVHIDGLTVSIEELDTRMRRVCAETEAVRLVRTLPGIGFVLGIVVALEVGEISRFGRPEQLASYAGTTPRVHASGGRVRYGSLRTDVNQYLKWAFAEAANTICINRHLWPERHVARLYQRLRQTRGHRTAIGAVSRHLAEATYWVLTKQEPYRDPALRQRTPTEA